MSNRSTIDFQAHLAITLVAWICGVLLGVTLVVLSDPSEVCEAME
jgi:hypothetical protein